MTETEKRETFVALYESQISRNWPGRGKDKQADRQYWWNFVDQVPEEQLEPLFERVTQNRGNERRLPLLPEFKKAWGEIKPKKRSYAVFQKCAVCEGSGIFSWPAWHGRDENGNLAWSLNEEEHILSSYAFACRCTAGETFRNQFNYPREIATAAFEQIAGFLRMYPPSNELMTLREFLKREDAEPVMTLNEFTYNLIQTSLRNKAIRDGSDPAPYERKTSRVTLARLRQRLASLGRVADHPEKVKYEPELVDAIAKRFPRTAARTQRKHTGGDQQIPEDREIENIEREAWHQEPVKEGLPW